MFQVQQFKPDADSALCWNHLKHHYRIIVVIHPEYFKHKAAFCDFWVTLSFFFFEGFS